MKRGIIAAAVAGIAASVALNAGTAGALARRVNPDQVQIEAGRGGVDISVGGLNLSVEGGSGGNQAVRIGVGRGGVSLTTGAALGNPSRAAGSPSGVSLSLGGASTKAAVGSRGLSFGGNGMPRSTAVMRVH